MKQVKSVNTHWTGNKTNVPPQRWGIGTERLSASSAQIHDTLLSAVWRLDSCLTLTAALKPCWWVLLPKATRVAKQLKLVQCVLMGGLRRGVYLPSVNIRLSNSHLEHLTDGWTGALYCHVLARKPLDSLQLCLWAFICVEDSLLHNHWLSFWLPALCWRRGKRCTLIKAKMLTKLLRHGLKRWMNLDHQCAAI